jgi:hypothetical protein
MTSNQDIAHIAQACQQALITVVREGFGCHLTALSKPTLNDEPLSAQLKLSFPTGSVYLCITVSSPFATGALLRLLRRPAGSVCSTEELSGFVGEFCNMVAGCAAGHLGAKGLPIEFGIPSVGKLDKIGVGEDRVELGLWSGDLGEVSVAIHVV